MTVRLSFIGGGVMGEAILSRLIASGTYPPEAIAASDPRRDRCQALADTYGIRIAEDNRAALAAETTVLAVKPQVLDRVAASVVEVWRDPSGPRPLVLSILAGTSLKTLEAAFPGCPLVRVMPNTPATVGAGISALAAGTTATADHLARARQVFAAVGQVVELPESLMDAVTGLSGSGPAFVALAIEALADGGVAAGLPRPVAQQLALQTVLGTAQLLQETGLHPAQLKDRTASPGGTTIAGIAQAERSGLRSALIEAVRAAAARSRELGQS